MNTRAADRHSLFAVPPPDSAASATPLSVRRSADLTWVDLTILNRAVLHTVQEQYGLPPEAMTYFLLHYQSSKLIHAGPALFLVTFFAIPSPRYFFITYELKLCVTPTLVVTLCGAPGKAQPGLMRTLPLPTDSEGKVGHLLCGLLESVVGSYEAIVHMIGTPPPATMPQDEQRAWRRRVDKLVQCLRDVQVLLHNVAREGGKLFAVEESQRLRLLEERVSTFVQTVWAASQEGKA